MCKIGTSEVWGHVIVFNVFLICYCIKKRKEESQDQIQSQVQLQVEKYFKLQSDTAF